MGADIKLLITHILRMRSGSNDEDRVLSRYLLESKHRYLSSVLSESQNLRAEGHLLSLPNLGVPAI